MPCVVSLPRTCLSCHVSRRGSDGKVHVKHEHDGWWGVRRPIESRRACHGIPRIYHTFATELPVGSHIKTLWYQPWGPLGSRGTPWRGPMGPTRGTAWDISRGPGIRRNYAELVIAGFSLLGVLGDFGLPQIGSDGRGGASCDRPCSGYFSFARVASASVFVA